MKKHLILVPRWGGTPAHDWYPWMVRELDSNALYASIKVCDMPNPGVPTISAWAGALKDVLAAYSGRLHEVVLVGHSVGCQTVLHALQALDSSEYLNAVVCVAGWWDVDSPWESILPWINASHDFEKIKSAARRSVVVLSDNDPFTADYQANGELWHSRLNSEVFLVSGAKHFNAEQEPYLLELLTKLAVED